MLGESHKQPEGERNHEVSICYNNPGDMMVIWLWSSHGNREGQIAQRNIREKEDYTWLTATVRMWKPRKNRSPGCPRQLREQRCAPAVLVIKSNWTLPLLQQRAERNSLYLAICHTKQSSFLGLFLVSVQCLISLMDPSTQGRKGRREGGKEGNLNLMASKT